MDDRHGQNAHLIRYSDDAVILTDREPGHAMDVLRKIISFPDLELNTEKTKITTAKEGPDFLGFHFLLRWNDHWGKEVTYVCPSDGAIGKFREKIRNTVPKQLAHRKTMTVAIQQVNAIIRGWYNYYKRTNAAGIFDKLYNFVQWKMAKYYCFIHKLSRVSSREGIYDKIRDYGLLNLFGKIQYVRTAWSEAYRIAGLGKAYSPVRCGRGWSNPVSYPTEHTHHKRQDNTDSHQDHH